MSGRPSAATALRAAGVLRSHGGLEHLELHTSGSTQTPRTVIRSLDSWVDSLEAFSSLSGMDGGDIVLVPAAVGSMFAFASAHAAWLGARTVAFPRWSPSAAADAARTCTAAHLTPTMLAALLERLSDHRRLRTVVCAGAHLPDPLRTRAADAGLRIIDYYGAAELSFVAIRHPDGAMRAFPGVEVALRGGVIWARSPYICDGYAPGQYGPLRRDADGWCTVGDLGHWHGDHGLVVEGRGDELILTGGASVLPGDVEHAMRDAPGVETAVAVGLPHPQFGEVVAVVVVARDGVRLDGARLRHHVSDKLSPSHRPRLWFCAERLPMTDAGKIARSVVRRALLDGALPGRTVR